jgi:hypothetical protein
MAALAGARVRARLLLPALCAALVARAEAQAPAPSTASATHLLVVAGLGGEPAFAQRFAAWSATLAEAATRAGVTPDRVVRLASEGGGRRATRAEVTAALAEIARRSKRNDLVLVAIFGHGSHQGAESRVNLPGPDLTAADLSRALAPLDGRRVVVVNAASASGDFVRVLAAPGRTVVAATKSAMERNETRFGGFFADALAGTAEGFAADADKDGRVSLLEAFLYAKRETARHYEQDNRLMTEHAVLDDDGDGTGSPAPGAEGSDGAAAREIFLSAAPGAAAAVAPGDTAAARLAERKRQLEVQVTALRGRKASMKAEEYEAQLETLLVELALANQALRARSGAGGGTR